MVISTFVTWEKTINEGLSTWDGRQVSLGDCIIKLIDGLRLSPLKAIP